MVARILYNQNSPSARQAQDFARELADLRVETELVEANSPEGISLTELYDLASRPAVVLLRNDGQMMERWLHELPLASDVSYLAHS